MLFIIEHLDPEIYEWSKEEYKHILKVLGKENVLFTNVKNSSELDFANTKNKSIKEMNLGRICILDPESKKTLSPEDKKNFDVFVFGGILGNDPPEKRTEQELSTKIKSETRNIGKKQMSTDTAAIVSWKILNGKKFEEIKFIDDPEIEIEEGLSTIMPYRYLDNGKGKPLISSKVMKLIKKGWANVKPSCSARRQLPHY
jgi:ribosome biogenesis SPOUT family RNA methylase Rps3